MESDLEPWLTGVLDSHATVVKEWSWPDGKAFVLEVRTDDGTRWFVKHHEYAEFYEAEVAAYERWVPALGDRAPQLRASNDDLQTLVLSALPSDSNSDWHDDDVRRDAGAVLRRLHNAEDMGARKDLVAEKEAELDRWVARGAGVLEPSDIEFARAAVRSMAGLPTPKRVPCHRDFTPRNWVIGGGRVHVVDFEEMQPDAWTTDLDRMALVWWPDQPHLLEPVLDGYGRRLSEDDFATMRCGFAVTAVRLIVLASELGKADFEASMRDVFRKLRSALA